MSSRLNRAPADAAPSGAAVELSGASPTTTPAGTAPPGPFLVVSIPGDPVAQGAPRAAVIAGRARVYQPKISRDWKATAQQHMLNAMAAAGRSAPLIPEGPVVLFLVAIWPMPKSRWRKTTPRPAEWHVKRPDATNVQKAVEDAAKGVLWLDDSQVAWVQTVKLTAPQGEAPQTILEVRPLAMKATAGYELLTGGAAQKPGQEPRSGAGVGRG